MKRPGRNKYIKYLLLSKLNGADIAEDFWVFAIQNIKF